MINKTFTVKLPKDAEARPVAVIVQIASQYESNIHLIAQGKRINAKSIMGMMSLGLFDNEEMEIEADGNDEQKATDEIIKYISSLA